MNAVYVYLIASSWFFLLGWVVLLLVSYALAFRGDSAQEIYVARAPLPASVKLNVKGRGRGRPRYTNNKVKGSGQECPPHTVRAI
jgi:uncharacterized protein (DUF58 family)